MLQMAPQWWSVGRRVLLAMAAVAGVLLMFTLWLGPVPLRAASSLLPAATSHTDHYHPLVCPCERPFDPTVARAAAGVSTCGEAAERRGFRQNVISFSVFGDMSGPFFRGVPMNAALAAQLYPGWTMRVYHDYNLSHPEVQEHICNLTCR